MSKGPEARRKAFSLLEKLKESWGNWVPVSKEEVH